MRSWYGSNACRMSSASLRKSSTKVSSFSGWMRFSRESVCTACEAGERLVDVHRVQQRLVEAGLELLGDDQHLVVGRRRTARAVCDSGKPFMFDSVNSTPCRRSTLPENATAL